MTSLLLMSAVMWLVSYGATLIARDQARPAPALAPATPATSDAPAPVPPLLLPDVALDEYVRSGLEDLRIMLVQHARGTERD